ncbi:LysR family transcriptional regulator [Mesorhizobium sp. DCY119]|uniref:LysR family transcriptional regulator n=1 Tax=Mesorhizobium sp. DCY119 TaxID=2108445 RepID=UPI000E7282D4|nr:LysR family transcriptional regulator [Mesorhizobium sp. DCY119]RJG40584.1 LysR family transcriptional regulator [Mesorhizobium sp. DCY119]
MAKLDLEWLSIFIEVYQCNSVSIAAERLGIAQATASIGLSKLRTYFNDRLFTRTSEGMQPTPYAKELYPVISDMLDTLSRARHAAGFQPATVERNFRISMTDISETVILPVLLNHLRKVAPRVSIQAEAITTESARRLEDGGVDLAIGFMPHLEAGFLQRTLFSETFVCLAARDHPRIGEQLTRSAFLSERHILVSTSGTGHFIVDKVLSKHGLQRNISLRLPSFLGVARIVASTELLVIVPRRVGESFANQEAVKLLDPPVTIPSYSVKLHWHERFHADTGNAWLRQTLAELFAPLKAGTPV